MAHPSLIALLGQPVSHSVSPTLHNTAFEAQGLNFHYVAHDVDATDLKVALEGMRVLGYHGANVTIPHKENVRPFLVGESETASAVGAVNTLVRKDDGWWGDNTDVEGFLSPLQEYSEMIQGSRVVIFGAGGAARAVVYGLLKSFELEQITLAVRSPDRANALVKDMEAYDPDEIVEIRQLHDATSAIRQSTLIVNATPVGMHPDIDQTPWEQTADLGKQHVVYDLVYQPLETRLLKQASSQGAVCITGLGMLVGQAAVSYRLWTGRDMPVETVRARLQDALH